MPLVSVIMPSYNSENSIEYSIKSVLNQTFKDFELIIIDGSQDSTVNKIKQINDERIKLFEIKNKGVVNSYRLGINKATGKYITFCDSDDLYNPDFLENAVKDIQENHCDFVSYAYDLVDEKFNKLETIRNTVDNGFYDLNQINTDIKPKLVFNSFIRQQMFIILVLRWNKIYKKELLLKFENDLDNNCYQIEDNVFTTLTVLNSKSFYINNDYKCYKYVVKQNSISNGYKDPSTLDKYLYSINVIEKILNKYEYKGNFNQLKYLAFDSQRIVFRRAAKNTNFSEVKKLIKKIVDDNYFKQIKYNELQMLKNKLFYILIHSHMYYICYLIFKKL